MTDFHEKMKLTDLINGPRKAWQVAKLFVGNDKSIYGQPPLANDSRWTNKGFKKKSQVYWVKIDDSHSALAIYLDSPNDLFKPWYHFEENAPIGNVTDWIEA